MFGYVQADIERLTQTEKDRYKAVYCGLCHSLGKRHGFSARIGLTYDMTFLALLLSSLYEPSETTEHSRCVVHPLKEHNYVSNECIDYAADMTVALVYFKCIDDWNDDRKIIAKGYSTLLSNAYKKVKINWPSQCEIIENELANLSKIETNNNGSADDAANCFGRLMEALFVFKKDFWSDYLKKLGYGLGRYIYFADASADLKKDIKKGSYNPLVNLISSSEDFIPRLQLLLGEASEAFEMLPLIQDEEILKNIMYSGIWTKYIREIKKENTDDN